MKQAKFIYVDKQKNVYPFVMKLNNEHSSFISEQVVQLKEIGLTTPKLYDLIAVETFIPRLHHSKPTVIFDQYIEVAEQEKEKKEYYFLFGQTACRNYDEAESFELFMESLDTEFAIHKFVEGEHPEHILEKFVGWTDYKSITKEEYEQLSDIEQED